MALPSLGTQLSILFDTTRGHSAVSIRRFERPRAVPQCETKVAGAQSLDLREWRNARAADQDCVFILPGEAQPAGRNRNAQLAETRTCRACHGIDCVAREH